MIINRKKWTFIWAALFLFFMLAWWDLYQGFILIGNPPSFESKRFDVFLAFQVVPIAIWAYLLWVIRTGRLPGKHIESILGFFERVPIYFKIIIAGAILLLPPYIFLHSSFGDYETGYWFRLAAIAFFAFLATIILFPRKLDVSWKLRFSGIFLLTVAIFITADWFTEVVNYPFTLGWSEGNRMWDYSMMFGSDRYINLSGKPIFTFIETGRQVLWAIPFLLPNLNIAGFRLWNILVWILPSLLLGWAFVAGGPFSWKRFFASAGFVLWTYVFLSQGPIYSPLLLAALLVVISVRQRSLIIGIILVAIAAYYSQISRWTWMYAPGLWAAMLAFMDVEINEFNVGFLKKLIKPVALGLAGYFGGEFMPNIIDAIQNGPTSSATFTAVRIPGSLVQPMLWDRLFPNPTYAPGILLGMLWVGFPIVLFLFWIWKSRVWQPHWLQVLPALLLSGIFLVLGVIVSVKAGGGSNLHNLDMLWVTLALLAGWVWKKWMDAGFPGLMEKRSLLIVLCFAIIMPFTTMVQTGQPLRLPPDDIINSSLERIVYKVTNSAKFGEVLFIDQRQLLTFGYINGVPLIADYEKKYLMNQALNGNEKYFSEFYKKLENHEYVLIVTEPMRKALADEEDRNFAEENNSWVYWVSRPMLKYYEPYITFDEVGVQLLIPRKK